MRSHVMILQATEERMRRQAWRARGSLVLAYLLARVRQVPPLVAFPLVVVGCASPSLMPSGQAQAIQDRERALAAHSEAIQAAMSQAGQMGALAFLDARDGHLIVQPGNSPAEAWARFTTSDGGPGSESVPPVLTFVHRADVPKAPEAVTLSELQQQQALRASVASLETDLRDAHQRIEERLGLVQRDLAGSVATTKALADARAELQKQLNSLAEDLAAARNVMRQTAQLASVNQESNLENASGIRKVTTASQELAATSARLEEAVRKLSETLTAQFEELARRLDAIQGKAGSVK